MIVYKPAGPTKILAALRACVDSMTGTRRPSNSSRRSSNLSSNGSMSPRLSITTPSEGDASSPYSSHSRSSASHEEDRTYFSGTPGSSSSPFTHFSGHSGALHSFSPHEFLQRRRSEEERDITRRKPKRPSIGARSITFQPDTSSPLTFDGYSGPISHAQPSFARKQSQSSDFDMGSSPTPSSPGSTISIAGGGALLRSAVAPPAVVAAIKEAEVKHKADKLPSVLVVEVRLRQAFPSFLVLTSPPCLCRTTSSTVGF